MSSSFAEGGDPSVSLEPDGQLLVVCSNPGQQMGRSQAYTSHTFPMQPFPSLGGAFKGEKVLDVAPSYNEDPEPLSETEVTQEEPDSRLEESTETSSSNKDNNGTLRGRPQNLQPRDTVLRITVQKWGFKDATLFQQPRVVVSVRDEQGEVLEAVQAEVSGGSKVGKVGQSARGGAGGLSRARWVEQGNVLEAGRELEAMQLSGLEYVAGDVWEWGVEAL
eukprot:1143032-Pelagomonas_calceolata.AAC.2